MRSRALMMILAVAAVAIGPQTASATPVTGILSIVGNVALTKDTTSFPDLMPGTNGVVGVSSGDFASLSGTAAILLTLDKTVDPVGAPISLPDFVTLTAAPDIVLNLTKIDFGIFTSASCGAAPAVGQLCTPTGTEFNFINTPSGSIASFSVEGVATRISTGEETPFQGDFTFQFAGIPYQNVLAALAAGGTVSGTYSASFDVVPEPATALLLGLGALALAAGRRRLA